MKLLIATPCALGLTRREYAVSLAGVAVFLSSSGISFDIRISEECDVGHARNRYASMMLDDPACTHLMFIDADMAFPHDGILRLLARNKPIVGGLYCKKNDRCEPTMLPLDGEPEGPFTRCLGLATGFMLIQRRVFEELRDRLPELCVQGNYVNVFETAVRAGCFLSTDYNFCALYRSIGGDVWVDKTIDLGHVGSRIYALKKGD